MKFPEKCPYCGKDIAENIIEAVFGPTLEDQTGVVMQIHECLHCKMYVYVFRGYLRVNGVYVPDPNTIICYHPINPIIDFPKHIKELSPEACKVYADTFNAYHNGLNSLVGAGLRTALEWLVWDYLIKIKNIPEIDLEKLKLFERIQKMDAPLYTNICAKLIRLFGNDQVHIIKKLDFTFDEVFNAYNILCDLINNELDLIEIQKRLTT